jgi:oxygen-independent coproporphyrinogen-3 oxidase
MDFGVYVHVPFCRVQCPYCTFFTVQRPAGGDAVFARFAAALAAEWRGRVAPRLARGDRLATLYLGGGTPSDLPVAVLAAWMESASRDLPGGLAALDEVTVECNPESSTAELLDRLAASGVDRISLGVQALDDRDLMALGRAAGAAEGRRAISAVRSRFRTWNADLILGIPGSSWSRLRSSLDDLADAGAPHLSFYCLELPPGTARRCGDPQSESSEAWKADLYERASDWVTRRGFVHYEISNAALPGHEARHNNAYWQGGEYVGLGPGAHSFEAGERRANVPDLGRWLAALEAGAEPPSTRDRLDAGAREREALLLGLRLREGLSLASPVLGGRRGRLEALARAGLAEFEDGRVRLTPRGWLVSDAIVVQLLAA